MPICSFCKNDLLLEKFSKMGETHQSKCKECHREYRKKHYQENREKYINKATYYREKVKKDFQELKSKLGGCKFCGEQTPCCLDFHHLRDKIDGISQLVQRVSWEKLLEEIDKCIILCANCHRKLHKGLIELPNEVES